MPYPRRRRTYRRRTYRRPSRRSSASSHWSGFNKFISSATSVDNLTKLAESAYWGVQRLSRLVNVEVKKFDAVVASGTAVNSTGSAYPLHEIAQGDTDQTRDGNSIKPLSNLLSIQLANNATAVNTRLRVLLVKDLQQIADTTPAVSDVLDGSVASFVDAPLNNLAVGRFKILKDRTFTLTTVSAPVINFKWYTKLYGHIRYNGTASTDVQKGGLYLLFVSDQATNTPTMGFNTRLSFTDN